MNCLKCAEWLPKGGQACPKCGAAVQLPPADAYVDLIKDRTENFTGRDWVFRRINAWLEAGGPPVYVLKGGPGSGKTAVSARLVQMSHGTAPASDYARLGFGTLTFAHFCQAQVPTSRDPRRFVEALSATLAHLYQPFARALAETPVGQVIVNQFVDKAEAGSQITGAIIHVADVHVGNLSSTVAFDVVVRKPLEQLCTADFDETLVILVDALDEAWTYDPDDNIATLLGQATGLPPQVRFLLTTRSDLEVLHAVTAPALDLIADAPDQEDVRAYAYRRLEDLSAQRRAALAHRIAEASEGNFLYARYIVNDLSPNIDQIDDLSTLPLPKGLDGIYRQFLERTLARAWKQWSQYRPLLGAVAVAQGQGLTSAQLAGVMARSKHLSEDDTSDFLLACSQYLAGPRPDGPFRIYHQSFRDFLLTDKEYQIFPSEANRAVGEFFVATYGDAWLDCRDDYALKYAETHLKEAGQQMSRPEQKLARQEVQEELAVLQTDRSYRLARSLRFGRSWVFRRLNDWLASSGPQVFLLTGEPGSGKTALASQLVELDEGKRLVDASDYPHLSPGFLAYAHFCKAVNAETVAPDRFWEAFSEALARRYDVFRSKLPRPIQIHVDQKVGTLDSGGTILGLLVEELDLSRLSGRAVFDQKVRQPLIHMTQLYAADSREMLVILVDAIDEAAALGPEEGLADVLSEAVRTWDLPPQVRFVLTSRPDPRILALFGGTRLDLNDDVPYIAANVDDVASYVYGRFETLGLPQSDRLNLSYRLAEASDGNFLYACMASSEMLAHPDRIDQIGDWTDLGLEGLVGKYRNLIDRELGGDMTLWRERYRPILGPLAVAQGEGLTKKQLAGVTRLSSTATDESILACAQFLVGPRPDGPYRLFHESFGHLLLTPEIDFQYRIDAIEANQSVADFFCAEYSGKWNQCQDNYALQYTPAHLLAALDLAGTSQEWVSQKPKDMLIALLTDLSFLEARAQRLGLETALADVRYASLYLPNLEPATKDCLSDVAAKVSSQFLDQSVGMSQFGAAESGSTVSGIEIRRVNWGSKG